MLEFRFRDHPERFWILKDAQGPRVEMHGAPAIVRRLPATLELSPVAEKVAAVSR